MAHGLKASSCDPLTSCFIEKDKYTLAEKLSGVDHHAAWKNHISKWRPPQALMVFALCNE